jgi:VIT1/CCC1 family predicted Fe2+/Mn2+ transporter
MKQTTGGASGADRSARAPERHFSTRTPWIRAAVLGADDGILSTASLMIGVAAASRSRGTILIAGLAGLVAGATSMAVGEYVSVSSQRDTELADLQRERRELEVDPAGEKKELEQIYRNRGLSKELSARVADELSSGDRLAVHARDELGLDQGSLARPLQAAGASAASFAIGAALPVVGALLAPAAHAVVVIVVISLLALGLLGAAGARLGGAPLAKGAFRVLLGGGLAMIVTTAIGKLVGMTGL